MTPTAPMDLVHEAYLRGVRMYPLEGELTVIGSPDAADVVCRIWQQRDEVLRELYRLGYDGPPGTTAMSESDWSES